MSNNFMRALNKKNKIAKRNIIDKCCKIDREFSSDEDKCLRICNGSLDMCINTCVLVSPITYCPWCGILSTLSSGRCIVCKRTISAGDIMKNLKVNKVFLANACMLGAAIKDLVFDKAKSRTSGAQLLALEKELLPCLGEYIVLGEGVASLKPGAGSKNRRSLPLPEKITIAQDEKSQYKGALFMCKL
jgi:hypothetical protein